MARYPLNVLQVVPALESGGVERGTLEISAALVRRGHHVTVLSESGRMLPALLDAGVAHCAVPVGRKSLATFLTVSRVRECIGTRKFDVIDVHSRLPAWVVHFALQGMPVGERPALVSTLHGFYGHPRYSRVMVRGVRVIAVSESLAEFAISTFPKLDKDRLRVIPRGVDLDDYPSGYQADEAWHAAWYRAFPRTRDQFLVTLPARMTRWKGQEAFIGLIESLRKSGLPAHGVMVGDMQSGKQGYVEGIHSRIQASGLSDSMTICGHREDLREILSISDVVVSLSTDPEAFGRSTLEALSIGRPVCAFDHGGVGEQLRTLLPQGAIPVGNLSAMAGRIRAWRDQPPQVSRENPFTLERMIEKTLSVYQEASDQVTVD